jgi:hypothetical protein
MIWVEHVARVEENLWDLSEYGDNIKVDFIQISSNSG